MIDLIFHPKSQILFIQRKSNKNLTCIFATKAMGCKIKMKGKRRKRHPFFLVLMNIQENGESLWAIFVKTSSQKKPFLVWKHILYSSLFYHPTPTSQFSSPHSIHHNNNNTQPVTCLNFKYSFKIDYECATSMNFSPERKSESHKSIKKHIKK